MMKLGNRLEHVAKMVGHVHTLADIGADHAKVPIYLISQGEIQRAIVVEVTSGPFKSASQAVYQAGLRDRISVLLGDGLHPIMPGEVDTFVIAGMGGTTIWDILTSQHAHHVLAHGPHTLVLQPLSLGGLLRYGAPMLGYEIQSDQRVEENGIIYECMRLVANDDGKRQQISTLAPFVREAYDRLSPSEKMRLACGEMEIKERSPWLLKAIQAEIKKREEILNKVSRIDRGAKGLQILQDEHDALYAILYELQSR